MQGWTRVKRELEDTFRAVTQLGYAVLFISHDKDKTFKREDGTEYNQIIPTLGSSYNLIIKDMVDIYAYAHIVIKEGESKRVLTLRSFDNTIDCGTRFRYMQPEVPFSYDALVEALNKAIDEEARESGNEFITNDRNIETKKEELNFDVLMDEFTNLIQSIPSDKMPCFAPSITEITDKYLGKGKKVAQATRDQVEQISLIVFDLKELLTE